MATLALANQEGNFAALAFKGVPAVKAKAWKVAAKKAGAPKALERAAELIGQLEKGRAILPVDGAKQKIAEFRLSIAKKLNVERFGYDRLKERDEELTWAETDEKKKAEMLATAGSDYRFNRHGIVEKEWGSILGAWMPKEWLVGLHGATERAADEAAAAHAAQCAWIELGEIAADVKKEAAKAGIELPPLRFASEMEREAWKNAAPRWAQPETSPDVAETTELFMIAVADGHTGGGRVRYLSPNGSAMGDMGRAKIFGQRDEALKWGKGNAHGHQEWGVIGLEVKISSFEIAHGAGTLLGALGAGMERKEIAAAANSAASAKPEATDDLAAKSPTAEKKAPKRRL
jgi:hypothetical protein